MAYRKKTLRKMLPVTRELARTIGEMEGLNLKVKHLLKKINELEMESKALHNINR